MKNHGIMKTVTDQNLNLGARKYADTVIRLAVAAGLVYLCWQVVTPFVSLIMWGLVLAVALYPLHQSLTRKVGGKDGRASTIMVLGTLLLIGTPLVVLALTVVDDLHNFRMDGGMQSIQIAAPDPSVADWPVIGEKAFKAWDAAATNMAEFQKVYASQLDAVSEKLVDSGLGSLTSVLLFLAAMAVAGIMMAFGKGGADVMLRIANRLAGPEWGADFHRLTIATIRSVATGVIGVAFIQSLLFGICFVIIGLPFAGLLAIAVMIVCIIQLPAIIFSIPVIAYLWMGGDGSTLFNIVMTVCLLVAGIADNILKPILLGRGVKAPMPVILIGALGGMVAMGFIGLFLGAVLLALGYQIFMGWVDRPRSGSDVQVKAPKSATSAE